METNLERSLHVHHTKEERAKNHFTIEMETETSGG